MAAALALIAAAIFALGTVLQQRAAMTEPEDQASSNTILLRLATHPVWLAGIAAYGLAYLVQAAALGSGQIVVVRARCRWGCGSATSGSRAATFPPPWP